MSHCKRICLEGANNVRDLGGIPVKEGKMTAWNRLYRADRLKNLTKSDWKILLDSGVRTIVDLRSLSEVKAMPDQVPAEMSYVHCPMMSEKEDAKENGSQMIDAFSRSLKEGYLKMVREDGILLVQALHMVIAHLKQGAVLFHCTAGKDRTGVLAATLLLLLGAYIPDIIADYQVSYTFNKKGINAKFQKRAEFQSYLPLLRSDAENIEQLLIFFEQQGGETYLKERGLKKEEIESLRKYGIE